MGAIGHVQNDIAIAGALAYQSDRLVEMIKLNLNNTRVWKNKLNMQAFNLFGKSMSMIILEIDW